jgi:amidophosphoribosyltransferase
VEEIRQFIGLDSLAYLSLEGMVKAMPQPSDSFCLACYSGHYPVHISSEADKFSLEK